MVMQVILSVHQRMKADERKKETIGKWQVVQANMQEAADKGQV
jgi:hypothetical protein